MTTRRRDTPVGSCSATAYGLRSARPDHTTSYSPFTPNPPTLTHGGPRNGGRPAPLLVWPLLAKRYRAFAWATSLTALLLAISFATGSLSLPRYLQLLSELGSHEAQAGFGLIGLLRNLSLTSSAAQASAFGVATIVMGSAYAYYLRSRDEGILYGAGIVWALLLTPVLWSHYFVLLPAALLALDARRRWFIALAIASWVIAPPHGLQ
jgi:hypothetical protein